MNEEPIDLPADHPLNKLYMKFAKENGYPTSPLPKWKTPAPIDPRKCYIKPNAKE